MAGARAIGPDTALQLPATLRELHVGPHNRVPPALAGLPRLRLHVMDVFNNAGLQVLASSSWCLPCTCLCTEQSTESRAV